MNITLYNILSCREDISEYVFHFCKKSEAKDTLKKILTQMKLISDRGYICFSETPITMISPMFDLFSKFKDPLYAPYGIGIKKDFLFEKGARHVIYGSEDDVNVINEELMWRFQEYTPQTNDFSWLREWRIKVNELDLSTIDIDSIVVVVDKNDDLTYFKDFLLDFEDVEIDAEPDDGGCTCFFTEKYKRKLKAISMESINMIKNCKKEDFNKILSEQKEIEEQYCGSGWS